MRTYIGKRLLGFIVVLIGVTLLSFIFSNISKVDPAEAMARRMIVSPTPKQIESIREDLGLNQPIYRQYFRWVWRSLHGDLGQSFSSKRPVAVEIAEKFPATLMVVLMAFFWIVLFTFPISITAAIKKGGIFDHTVKLITILGVSIPSFWLGFMMLIIFAIKIPIFKVVGYGNFKSLILPSLTLAIPMAASSIRLFRATLLSNMHKDFVIYAKARGISDFSIMWHHVLKNSLPPLITVFGQCFAYMLAGSAIVENVFSWPGLGSHLLEAILNRDLPTVNGCVLLIAVIFVFCNLISDLINIAIHPKLLNEEGEL